MSSLYLNRLPSEKREELLKSLHESQHGKCFICGKLIDLSVHKDAVDIDHVIPVKVGGKDDPSNFAITHSSCNRSKQDANLEVARILHRYEQKVEELKTENRGPNLNDILKDADGSKYELSFEISEDTIKFSFPDIGINRIIQLPIFNDQLSGFRYFFSEFPIQYIFHDDKINPRPIGRNISKLIKEFYLKRPQLHVCLGWISSEGGKDKIRVFDGQHKTAAQVLLGATRVAVRVFIDPDVDILLTTNTNAGTVLRQVAFDKSVQRHLGSSLYIDRVEKYKKEHNLSDDDFSFSEQDLVKHFKGESREMKRYILDSVRDSITHNPDNKLKDYIDFGGRGKERPLSYSSIEKTFYSFFIFQNALSTPLEYGIENGINPRELEKEQIVHLMNLVAENILIDKFDMDIGTYRLENRIQKGESIPLDHLKAHRLTREEVMYNWLKYVEQIIKNYFIMQGKPIQESKLFHYKFPDTLWERVGLFLENLFNLPIWSNKELSATIFGGKQNYDFWQTIFETGKTSQGVEVLPEPIDLMKMIQN
ncbi:MAG: HNH endonuclease [Methanobacteriota archaeon]|nr:MAG: HNH endonuclease [Euryarchaeota archaeon]